MKIIDFSLSRLRNEEHFQFQTSLKDLVVLTTPSTLKIDALFATFLMLYDDESKALDVIQKSAISDNLVDADVLRDETFRGMSDAVKSSLKHFRTEVRSAAQRLQIVFDNYGNIAIKSYDAETAAITSLINDLQGIYAADAAVVGITEWVTELKANNTAFDDLKNNRYSEEANKTQLRMKQVRTSIDAVYYQILERINALIVVEGEANYTVFVNEINKRIDGYNKTLAIRKGKAKKADDNTTPAV